MIDEIFDDYEKQNKEYVRSMIDILELDIPEIEKLMPKSNYDLELLFKEIELIDKDESIIDVLDQFYIDTMKRGIVTAIPLGKSFMAKMYRDDRDNFNDFLKKDSSLLTQYMPSIKTLKDLTDNFPERKEKMKIPFKKMEEEDKIALLIQGILKSFSVITDDNREMIDYHFQRLFQDLGIDLKLAKKRCNKRVKLGYKSKIVLMSDIYKDMKGKTRVTDLVRQHCKVIFEEGMRIGIRNGIKIAMEDIQSKRIDPRDFSTMELDKLSSYFYKETNEVLDLENFE